LAAARDDREGSLTSMFLSQSSGPVERNLQHGSLPEVGTGRTGAGRAEAFGAGGPAGQALDRVLLARLHFTRVQRGGQALTVYRDRERVLSCFRYAVAGMSIGLSEGVLSGPDGPMGWLTDAADESGADLLKVTRALPEAGAAATVEPTDGAGWTVVDQATRARELLVLPGSFEEFLGQLGRHTRRNIRGALKAAAASGFAFTVSTGAGMAGRAELTALARRTRPRRMSASLRTVLEDHADGTGRPFRSVIRNAEGGIVSYCCGYLSGAGTAYLLYQLNDSGLNAISPSLLHRAYLVEWLVGVGCGELVFVHGCSGILFHACVRQPLEEVFLMRRSWTGYARSGVLNLLTPKASVGQLARMALSREMSRRVTWWRR